MSEQLIAFLSVPWVPDGISKRFFRMQFFRNEWIFKGQFQRSFVVIWTKLTCIYKLFPEYRIATFHQLFSWNSVVLLKCLTDKMSISQEHLTVWIVHSVPRDISKREFHRKILSNKSIFQPPIQKLLLKNRKTGIHQPV